MNILLAYGYTPGTTAFFLERALARDHHVTYAGTPWPDKPGYAPNVDLAALVAALPAERQPDLCLYVDAGGSLMFPRGLAALSCPTVGYLIDVHVGVKLRHVMAPYFDYLFVAQKDAVAEYRALGCPQVAWLPLAVDPEIIRQVDLPKIYDVGFAGNIGSQYQRRRDLLAMLAQRYTMNDYHRFYNQAEMAELYSASKIIFNNSLRDEVNMRVFEAIATGSLLVTDRIANGLTDLLTDGQHLILYDNDQPTRMLDLVERYVRDDQARTVIAQAGRQHVLAHHTYQHRAARIIETVFGNGAPYQDAPARRFTATRRHQDYAQIYSMMRLLDATFGEFSALRRSGPADMVFGARQLAFALYRIFRQHDKSL